VRLAKTGLNFEIPPQLQPVQFKGRVGPAVARLPIHINSMNTSQKMHLNIELPSTVHIDTDDMRGETSAVVAFYMLDTPPPSSRSLHPHQQVARSASALAIFSPPAVHGAGLPVAQVLGCSASASVCLCCRLHRFRSILQFTERVGYEGR
jgi:hypothetical protein